MCMAKFKKFNRRDVVIPAIIYLQIVSALRNLYNMHIYAFFILLSYYYYFFTLIMHKMLISNLLVYGKYNIFPHYMLQFECEEYIFLCIYMVILTLIR